jgi:hypothetical protein
MFAEELRRQDRLFGARLDEREQREQRNAAPIAASIPGASQA